MTKDDGGDNRVKKKNKVTYHSLNIYMREDGDVSSVKEKKISYHFMVI